VRSSNLCTNTNNSIQHAHPISLIVKKTILQVLLSRIKYKPCGNFPCLYHDHASGGRLTSVWVMESVETLYLTVDMPAWTARAIPVWRLITRAVLCVNQSPRRPAATNSSMWSHYEIYNVPKTCEEGCNLPTTKTTELPFLV